jgi:hypothetical protein
VGQSGGEVPPEPGPPFGWRSAGLTPDPSEINKWGTGLAKIAHSNEYIFVMDAAIEKDESSPGYRQASHRIFISRQGIETWDTLKLPQDLDPLSFYGDSSGLYVGSFVNAAVWHYEPASKKWTNMNVLELAGNQGFNVYGITRLNGQLVASLAGFNDTTVEDKLIIAPILLQQPDGAWKDISPPNTATLETPAHLRDTPLQFFIAHEWRGDLFAATARNGVWRYSTTSGQWGKVPNPNKPSWNFDYNGYYSEEYIPQALAIHKDRLYMAGRAGGIYMLNDDLNSWVGIDSIRINERNSLNANTPLEPYSLASDGENLFVSGTNPGIPAVYVGDRGEPKGWRRVDMAEWCNPSRFSCLGISTYGLDVIGDTLYAAAWEGLYKFPLADLDSAIINEDSYR